VLSALQNRVDSLEHQQQGTDTRPDDAEGQVSSLEKQPSESQYQQTIYYPVQLSLPAQGRKCN